MGSLRRLVAVAAIFAAQTLFDFGDSWKYNYPYGPFLLVSYRNTIEYGLW